MILRTCLTTYFCGILALNAQGAQEPIGLSIDLTSSSSYIFRGYNLFQDSRQRDQNAMVAPTIIWNLPNNRTSITFFSAYQTNGKSVSRNVKGGVGAEQDLILNHSLVIDSNTQLNLGFSVYSYPLAEEDEAGVSTPIYLEPSVFLTDSNYFDYSIGLSYFRGQQEEIKQYSYLYWGGSIGKSFVVEKGQNLDMLLSAGYKSYDDQNVNQDKDYDVQLAAALPINLKDGYYISPKVGLAWTNISDLEFSNELAYFVAVSTGASF
ncbi:hypothetical protein [Pseudobacteriovorax antillogorgiicola]|uniref:MetA-pathway of phenol degradation n=1 Tax=Pseudobacteriovorax antillogorgiicola TaxID=1513793 RepID=A0A1Y6CNH7_9BACT|nr:hypothetical protein [Pseudobacteriovorax antillogorgiicola]TCS43653.1 hypothetical protein EDD56_13546 [Pseudobacteriovorax antillogorgiicola]SMF79873.1 hypothetical protein SAMN06296036_1347 [Pseudobacteriovorax antillogorgiicola]